MTANATSMRVVLYAPHFAEYATRLAIALAAHAKVMLFLDRLNRINECDDALMCEARRRLKVVEFASRGRFARQFSRMLLPLRTRLFRPDLIHVQEQPDPLTASIVSLMGSTPILLTVHDPSPHSGNDRAYAMRMDQHRRLLRGTAAGYHVHGRYCRNLLVGNGFGGKSVVSTAHGVILTPKPDAGGQPQPGRILMFGRMEAYKGIDTLLKAVEILRARAVAFRLVFAGRGPELDKVRDAVQSLDDVEVIDKFLTPEEATREFQRAALVVVPYRDATQSGVVAAAFGNGRPVVASRVGGLVDAIRDGTDGLLVPPDDADALANALARVLQDDVLRRRLSEGARAASRGEFDWDRIAGTLIKSYRDLRLE
jgi:glycosyltransferase involved in cell wall biosynthesis